VTVDEDEVLNVARGNGVVDRGGLNGEEHVGAGSRHVFLVLAVTEATQFRHCRQSGEGLPFRVRRRYDRVVVDRKDLVEGLPDVGGSRGAVEQGDPAVDLGDRHRRQDDRLVAQ